MNCTCYLFGRFKGKYTQYPQDETQRIFEAGVSRCTKEAELIVHREGHVMYYIYVTRLNSKIPSYIGVCVSLTDLMCTDIPGMYTLLESAVTNLAVTGRIIDFGHGGGFTSTVSRLNEMTVDCNQLFKGLMSDMNRMEESVSKLPPVNYGADKDSYNSFQLGKCDEKLTEASTAYGYLLVFKDTNRERGWSDIEKILKIDKETHPSGSVSYGFTKKDFTILVLVIIIVVLLIALFLK